MSMSDTRGAIPPWTPEDRLIKARRHARLTQGELAEQLGIGVRTVKRYEDGDIAKRGIVLGWALACGVDPGWLETGNTSTDTDGNNIRYRYLQAA